MRQHFTDNFILEIHRFLHRKLFIRNIYAKNQDERDKKNEDKNLFGFMIKGYLRGSEIVYFIINE